MNQTSSSYDVYISYSPADRAWVRNDLLPRLEEAGVRVHIDFRDFEPGLFKVNNMERAVARSRFILLILTPAWLSSEANVFDSILAQTDDLIGRRQRTIPLLLEVTTLPPRLEALNKVDFTEPDELSYEWERLLRTLTDDTEMQSPLPPGQPASFFLPFLRNQEFQGRDEDLMALHDALSNANPAGVRPTGLTGMAGVGKTELAVEYCYRYRGFYPGGVFWVNAAEDWANGRQSFAALGRRLDPRSNDQTPDLQMMALVNRLQARPDSLLVLDNVAEPAQLTLPIAPGFTPAGLPCRVLFTTRRRDLGNFIALEVPVLPLQQALHLLLRTPERLPILDPEHPDHPDAIAICRLLGYLPLALEIAGAFLGAWQDVQLADFRDRLRAEGGLATLDEEGAELSAADLRQIHVAAVEATLREQWEALEKGWERDANARRLLRVAGQLPEAAQIPLERLGLLARIETHERPGGPSPLARAARRLETLSLIEELHGDELRLHPLVREFAARRTPQIETNAFRAELAANLADAYGSADALIHQLQRRGVDAVQLDLVAALALRDPIQNRLPTDVALVALLQMLQSEAHALRSPGAVDPPVYLAQQLYKRARDRSGAIMASLADELSRLLETAGHPHFRVRWHTNRESPALERTLTGHAARVSAVVLAPGRAHALSASQDCTLKLWNLETGEIVRTLSGHLSTVHAVAVMPDGAKALSASEDHTLKLWNLETGEVERTFANHTDRVNAVAITPDNARAVSASDDRTLKIWNLETGEVERTFSDHTDRVNAVAIAPDGHYALSASSDHTLKFWNLESGANESTLTGHLEQVNAVAITSDSSHAISASHDQTLKLWDLNAGKVERTFTGHNGWVTTVILTPDGRALSGSSDRTLKLWNLKTGRVERTLIGHESRIRSVAITSDGGHALSASSDRTIRIWNLAADDGKELKAGHEDWVRGVAVTPDGRHVLSASSDRTLKLWNIETGELERVFTSHENRVNAVAITHDGRRLLSGSSDRTLKLWDLETGAVLATLKGHVDKVNAVVITPDNRCALSASFDHTIKFWNLETGYVERTLTGHTQRVNAVTLTPEGDRALSASHDHTVRLWNLESGETERIFTGHTARVNDVIVTPDGRRALSAASDHTMRLLNLVSGETEQTYAAHRAGVRGISIAPDGHHIFSVSSDRTLKLWNLETGDVLASIHLDGALRCLALLPPQATAAEVYRVVVGDATGTIYCLRVVE